MSDAINIEKFLQTNAWPFKEAQNILTKLGNKLPSKGYVLFETGYGPSGLPHIGTFGEVLRTTMVRHAFQKISGFPTRLFCISDDIDGMRKILDTIPNKEEFTKYLDLPLTSVPDPFGNAPSYAANMNARLRAFLDSFGFEYEFFSATDCYKNGTFNEALLRVLEKYEDIMAIMLPTLGEERQKTYSPFLPIDPESGKVLQVPIEIDKNKQTITYKNLNNNIITSEVTNGKCKLQWKPDFGMRWYAFDVDFEMYGKDHLVNGPIYTKICKALGGKAPHQMFYELFLDEKGEKISKSKGNGLTIDEWLRYGTEESLSYFMYQSPQKAKKLYFDIIPKCVDEYLQLLKGYHLLEESKKLESPIYHIHNGHPPQIDIDFSFSLLLNLVNACNSDDKKLILSYIKNAQPTFDISSQLLDQLIDRAINYYNDYIKSKKNYKTPSSDENALLFQLAGELEQLEKNASGEIIQNKIYEIGRNSGLDLKDWFSLLYQVLLGTSQGPRFGSFVALYGIDETVKLIRSKCL